jgi:hypothetical protein
MCQNLFLSEVKNLDFRLKTTILFSLKYYWSVFYICTQRLRYVIGRHLGTASLAAATNLDRNYKTIKLSKTAA